VAGFGRSSIPQCRGEQVIEANKPVDAKTENKASAEDFMDDPKSGLKVNIKTGLAPILMKQSISERGWMAGQIIGVQVETAALIIKAEAAEQGEAVFGDLFKKVVQQKPPAK
jgi:hypothetical protein